MLHLQNKKYYSIIVTSTDIITSILVYISVYIYNDLYYTKLYTVYYTIIIIIYNSYFWSIALLKDVANLKLKLL